MVRCAPGPTQGLHGVQLAFKPASIPALPQVRQIPRRVPTRTLPESYDSSPSPLWPARTGMLSLRAQGCQSWADSIGVDATTAHTQVADHAPSELIRSVWGLGRGL